MLFGRSKHFVLFDTAAETRQVVENPFSESLGDSGIQSAQMLIERNADAVIAGTIGRDALRILAAANIKVYGYSGTNPKDALALLLEDRLELIGAQKASNRTRKRRHGRST